MNESISLNLSVIEKIWWLLSFHYIFDWGLQSRWMGENKHKINDILFAHCMIYTGGISIALKIMGIFNIYTVTFTFITHYITDYISSRLSNKTDDLNKKLYILRCDHIIHFISLIYLLIF